MVGAPALPRARRALEPHQARSALRERSVSNAYGRRFSQAADGSSASASRVQGVVRGLHVGSDLLHVSRAPAE